MASMRAPFKWYGGKGHLAPKIESYLPRGTCYVEPFAGAASLFWRMQRKYPVEVLNDLHSEIVNFYRVLQCPEKSAILERLLSCTLYSFEEFKKAIDLKDRGSDIDRAWSFFVRQNQGFSGEAITPGNWSRSQKYCKAVRAWFEKIDRLLLHHERLKNVQVDNRDALECIRFWDARDTVFYLDPPYVLDTRKRNHGYQHEMDDEQHAKLIDLLQGIEGQAMLSGYDSSLYKPLEEAGWRKFDFEVTCYAVNVQIGERPKRKESIWVLNKVGSMQRGLFDEQ